MGIPFIFSLEYIYVLHVSGYIVILSKYQQYRSVPALTSVTYKVTEFNVITDTKLY